MSEHVEVHYATSDGTVVVEPHTAERVTVQQSDTGRALVKLYRAGRVAEVFFYRHTDRIHRVIEP